jgi:sirohydrochlorin ferrochelatase
MVLMMPWSRRFVDPIPTKGKPIGTLKEAAAFILKLAKAEQAKPHWQAATEAVIMAAEDRGRLMHANVGMKRALNAGKLVEFDPKQKSPH